MSFDHNKSMNMLHRAEQSARDNVRAEVLQKNDQDGYTKLTEQPKDKPQSSNPLAGWGTYRKNPE